MLNPDSVTSTRELLPQKHGFKSWVLSELMFAEHNLEKGKAKSSDENFESVFPGEFPLT